MHAKPMTTSASLTTTSVDEALESRAAMINDLARRIDFEAPHTILEFGGDAVKGASCYTDVMLAQAKADNLNETGKLLTEIVLMAQSFDVDALDNKWARVPVVGALLKSIFMAKEKVLSRFESVKAQIDKLIGSVERMAGQLQQRDASFRDMYAGVKHEYEYLGLHIEAVKLRLLDLDQEIMVLDPANSGLEGTERRAMLDAARQTLVKRADDLTVLHHSLMQMMPMIRILQANNLTIIDKFTTIRTLTLPTWKRSFLLALSLNEQRDAVQLADTIDNATNAMLKRNAELLKDNSIAIVKSNQRLVIDVSTLKSVHETVLSTLAEVRQIQTDGEASRASALQELGRLRREMIDGLAADNAK